MRAPTSLDNRAGRLRANKKNFIVLSCCCQASLAFGTGVKKEPLLRDPSWRKLLDKDLRKDFMLLMCGRGRGRRFF